MRVDRSADRPVHHLEWRVRLLGVGAVLALAGIWLENSWLINGALVVLLIGFGLRFIGRPSGDDEGHPDSGEGTPTE